MVSTETEQAPAVSEAVKEKKTIAVIPFVNLSSDPEQEYFVDGLSEELLNSLSQIPDLLVTARTSSFTFKGSDKKVQEIAGLLSAENIHEECKERPLEVKEFFKDMTVEVSVKICRDPERKSRQL